MVLVLKKMRRYFIIFCYFAFVPAAYGLYMVLPVMHEVEEARKIDRENEKIWASSPAYPVLNRLLQIKNKDGGAYFSKYVARGFKISGLENDIDLLGNNYVAETCRGQDAYFITNGRMYQNTGNIFQVFVCADLSGVYYSDGDKSYQDKRWSSLSENELALARSRKLTQSPITKQKQAIINHLYKYHAMPVDFE